MTYSYRTKGVCSRSIYLDISDDGVIRDIRFEGGCNGNTQGLCSLAVGRDAEEVRRALKGIRCESRQTSCPDQLSRAIAHALESKD